MTRTPFIFETARAAATADNVTGTPIGLVTQNALNSGNKDIAYDYMYVIVDKTTATNGDKVTFTVVNPPVDAAFSWAVKTGTGYAAGLTLPADSGTNRTSQSIEMTANSTTGKATVVATVKISGDSTGATAQGPDVTIS